MEEFMYLVPAAAIPISGLSLKNYLVESGMARVNLYVYSIFCSRVIEWY